MSRTKSREEAMIILFEKSFKNGQDVREIMDNHFDSMIKKNISFDLDYLKELCLGTYEKIDEIDKIIENSLTNWKMQRVSRVCTAILRITFYEIIYMEDVPERVSIDEAIELAKKYEDEKSGTFVNGIIGAYVNKNEPQNDVIKTENNVDETENDVNEPENSV